jgi:hypothetical protein
MTQEQTLQRLRQLHNVTRNYSVLRGLQYVPFGLFFLAVSTFQLGWLHLPAQWSGDPTPIVFGAFLVSLILYPFISNYYERVFGHVEQVQANKLDVIIMWLVIFVLAEGAIRIDSTMSLPISATGLVIALVLFSNWWRTNSFRTHILVLAILMGLISLLPLLGFTALSKLFLPTNGGFMLAFGLLLSVGGICDHLLLMRTFGGLRRGYHDEAI